jgi:site-specific DNA-methyltransferase (adenine-specific)
MKDCIEDNSVNLIFADPPYNIGKRFGDFHDKWPSDEEYAAWCSNWLDLCIKKLAPNGSMYIMTSTQAMPYLDIYLRNKISVISRIIWSYDSSGVQAKKLYGSMYEPIIFCVKDNTNYTFNGDEIAVEAKTGAQRKLIDYRKAIPTPYNTKKIPGNVWDFPRVRYRMDEYEEHPTQKPEALLERIIRASSNIGDTVLDPFSGTFTTSAVAKRLGRKSIGIDQNSAYVDIGLRRVLGMSSIDGRKLMAPEKNTKRKNAFGVKDFAESTNQAEDLFNVSC